MYWQADCNTPIASFSRLLTSANQVCVPVACSFSSRVARFCDVVPGAAPAGPPYCGIDLFSGNVCNAANLTSLIMRTRFPRGQCMAMTNNSEFLFPGYSGFQSARVVSFFCLLFFFFFFFFIFFPAILSKWISHHRLQI